MRLGVWTPLPHTIRREPRMADNDKIVSRYMDDKEFGETAFTVLSKAIYDSIPAEAAAEERGPPH